MKFDGFNIQKYSYVGFLQRNTVSSSKIGAVHANPTSWLLLYAQPSLLRFSTTCAKWRLVALSEHVG